MVFPLLLIKGSSELQDLRCKTTSLFSTSLDSVAAAAQKLAMPILASFDGASAIDRSSQLLTQSHHLRGLRGSAHSHQAESGIMMPCANPLIDFCPRVQHQPRELNVYAGVLERFYELY
jgi:hypothetical protein